MVDDNIEYHDCAGRKWTDWHRYWPYAVRIRDTYDDDEDDDYDSKYKWCMERFGSGVTQARIPKTLWCSLGHMIGGYFYSLYVFKRKEDAVLFTLFYSDNVVASFCASEESETISNDLCAIP